MSQIHSNKPRTQILDLVDESSQLLVLNQSDIQLVKGGRMQLTIINVASSCAVGGGYDYDIDELGFIEVPD
jgi:hypothetical protein